MPRLLLLPVTSSMLAGFIPMVEHAQAQQKPNIVFMSPYNLGLGEVGVYGGVRDVPTRASTGSLVRALD